MLVLVQSGDGGTGSWQVLWVYTHCCPGALSRQKFTAGLISLPQNLPALLSCVPLASEGSWPWGLLRRDQSPFPGNVPGRLGFSTFGAGGDSVPRVTLDNWGSALPFPPCDEWVAWLPCPAGPCPKNMGVHDCRALQCPICRS